MFVKYVCQPVRVFLCLAAALIFAGGVSPTQAATITWNNSSGGDWNDTNNWTPNQVPGPTDTAILNIGLSGPLTVPADAVLNWNSGTINPAGTLTIQSNAVVLWGNGEVDGTLLINAGGVLNFTNNTYYYFSGALTNYGTMNWTTGTLYAYTGAQIYNAGLFDAQSDAQMSLGGSPVAFVNVGTFRKSGGAGTTLLGWPTTSTGLIDQQTGSLNVNWVGDSILRQNFTGPVTLSSGATLALGTNMTLNWSSGTINSGSTITMADSSVLNWNGGTIGAGAALTVVSNAVVLWGNGQIDGAMTVNAGGVLNFTNNTYYYFSGALTNYGTMNWTTGTLYAYTGAQIYNAGLFDAQSDAQMSLGGSPVAFVNVGTFRKSGGAGTTLLGWPTTSTGLIDQQTGSLSVNWAGDSILRQNFTGPVTLASGANLALVTNVTLNWSSGTINSGSTITMTDSSVLNWNSGTIGAGAALTVISNAVVNWGSGQIDGAVTVNAGGVLNFTNNNYYYFSGTLTNYGTVNWTTGTLYAYTGAQIYNAGLFDAQSDAQMSLGGSPVAFVNVGTFRKSGGAGTTLLGWPTTSTGLIDQQTGSLSVNWAGDSILRQNFTGPVTLSSGATLALGTNMTLNWSSGTINSGSTITMADSSVLNWNSGTIGAGAALTVVSSAVVNWGSGQIDGAVTVNAGGVLNFTNNNYYYFSGTLTNYGTVNWTTGTLYASTGAEIYNAGLFDAQSDAQMLLGGSSIVFLNAGTFRKSGGTGATYVGWPFTNLATLSPQTGTINLAGTYDLTGGTMEFSLSGVRNFGKIQLSGSPATLGGSVTASFIGGYLPIAGDVFGVVTYSSETGAFNFAANPTVVLGADYGATLFSVIVSNVAPVQLAISNQAINEQTTLVLTNAATDSDISRRQLTGVSIPTGSMDGSSYPLNDGVWSVSVPPFPLANTGIGHLVDPAPFSPGSFTLHDHVYTNDYVPDPTRAVVTYEFTNAVVVSDIEVVQHANGITQIEGYVGDSTNSLVSIGSIFGPAGDTTTAFAEGQLYTFHFTNNLAGKFFRFVIRKTINISGYALYRAYPGTGSGNAFVSAIEPPNTIAYTLLTGPTNANISAAGVITWTPDETQGPSTNMFVTRATDSGSPSLSSTNTFTVVVNEVNTAPVLPVQSPVTISEGATLNVTNAASDADIPANTLTYTLVSAPAGASIGANGVVIWPTTEATGPSTNTFTTVVTDTNVYAINSHNLSATNTFTVVVSEINVAPVLTLPPNTNINEQAAYSAIATALDSDVPANALTFALVSGPSGLTVSPSGTVNWTPDETQGPSTNTVTIKVSDSNPWAVNATSLSVTSSYTIVVKELNTAPVLILPPNTNINEQVAFSATATATDADIPTNSLTFALVSGPSGLTVSPGGLISWTPLENQGPSTNTVSISVTDSNIHASDFTSLGTTNSFQIIVNEVNEAPILPGQSDLAINEGTTLSVTNTASDSDLPANTLSYTLLQAPGTASISPAGIITWVTTESDGPGTNTFKTKVTDNGIPPLSATNTFTVVVNEVNSAPVVGALSGQTVNPGQTISFTATATDSDLPTNTLTFALVSPPSGATISGAGAFSWRPAVAQADSTNVVKVKVTDNGSPSLSGTNSFTVIVNPLASATLTFVNYTNKQFTMHVSGTSGPDYIVAASTNLTTWADIYTNLSPSMPFFFTDTNAGGFDRFYRTRAAP